LTFRTWLAGAVAAIGIGAAVHYHQLGLTLAHYDARAHLVVSRRIFDSLIPGWQQVGGVWLPLPHLLNALPVQIDWLYRTGFSAVAISIASMAVAAWAIASLIHRTTGSAVGGAVASALLVLNPNVLYLQSTPMTEPLLFGTTFLAVALVGRWAMGVAAAHGRPTAVAQRSAAAAGGPPSAGASAPDYVGASSVAAGWALVAATLTRFEGWPIVAALIVLAWVVLVRNGVGALDGLRRVRGLALWPMWTLLAFLVNSKITVGSWFVSSGFFVPDNPARGQAWLAWTEVWDGLARLAGPLLPWLAFGAAVVIVTTAFRRRDSSLLVLSLAAAAVLPWTAYFRGHPFRVRYDVALVAAAAALIGTAVAQLPRRLSAAMGISVIALAVWQAPPLDRNAPVIVEAQRVSAEDAGRTDVTSYLRDHWDGQPIMMSMGSLAQYMHDLSGIGFNVRDFLHEGNGELWKYAMRSPRPFVEWIVIQEKADRDEIFRQAQADPRFLTGYARVVAGGGIALYRRIRT